MDPRVRPVAMQRSDGGASDDLVVAEEPLEIRVNDTPVSVTMRTPGDDFELAVGFLFTESIVRDADEIDSIRHWGSPNVVRVGLRDAARPDLARLQRNFYTASSCGVCGKASIDALRVHVSPLSSSVTVDPALIAAMPELLRERQHAFAATGGIHATAAFDRSGGVVCVREDVGRHNAVDKVAGSLFLERRSADALFVSGRTSFEIVQKCAVAGVPILAAVGAPTSLAVELASELNVTLIGFVRDGRFNVYTGHERLA